MPLSSPHLEVLVFPGNLSELGDMLLLILLLKDLPSVPGPHRSKGKGSHAFNDIFFPSGTRGLVERTSVKACSCTVLVTVWQWLEYQKNAALKFPEWFRDNWFLDEGLGAAQGKGSKESSCGIQAEKLHL